MSFFQVHPPLPQGAAPGHPRPMPPASQQQQAKTPSPITPPPGSEMQYVPMAPPGITQRHRIFAYLLSFPLTYCR
jgi:hypothetical protein